MPEAFPGGCHCGNVRYRYLTALPEADWPLRACGCSFCRRAGARYTSDPDSCLDVTVQFASMVQRYRFATRSADFLRCDKCGLMVLALARIDGVQRAVLNANTLDDPPGRGAVAVDHGDEQTEARSQRRRRNWTGEVRLNFINA